MFFFIIIYQYHLPISSINIQEKIVFYMKKKKTLNKSGYIQLLVVTLARQ